MTLRRFTFRHKHAVGGGSSATRGTAVDLLESLPYLFVLDPTPLPPLRVINDLLRRGRYDAGMSGGCLWRPFRLSRTEYGAVASELVAQHPNVVRTIVPAWVRSQEDWHCFALEYSAGVPAQKHRRLWATYRRLEKTAERARGRGDKKAHAVLAEKVVQAGVELSNFTEPYLTRYRQRDGRGDRARRRGTRR